MGAAVRADEVRQGVESHDARIECPACRRFLGRWPGGVVIARVQLYCPSCRRLVAVGDARHGVDRKAS